jgi:hypothetical protein
MSSFETDERRDSPSQRPVRVAKGKRETYSAALELCEDLGWRLVDSDPGKPSFRCERKNGFLGGSSTIEVWIEGPDGIPSSVTHVRSRSTGALLPRDRSIVREFVRKFTMRVC